MYAWVLVVLLVNGASSAGAFPTQAACEKARAAVVYQLSEEGHPDWGFAEPPYGSVSACVKVPLEKVERKV